MNGKDLFKAVFGESDSDDEGFQYQGDSFHGADNEENVDKNLWEEVKEISGLWICRNFLSVEQQNGLLRAIEQEGWFKEPSHNQAMRFGDLPDWASKLSGLVQRAICSYDVVCKICNSSTTCAHDDMKGSPLPPELLWREPLFDQMIVNAYQPGEGICAHVDLLRFDDGIAIISLESTCVMQFTQLHVMPNVAQYLEEQCSTNQNFEESNTKDNLDLAMKIPILLMPGDAILMCGEARYNWSHEINCNVGHQIWNGEEIIQRRRISITLRRLCSTNES
eukprot:Gb_33547 [translate_table: standard]